MAENEFYIQVGDAKDGPYDLMSMMRKISNGKVQAQDMIFAGHATEAIPALQVPDLADYFGGKTATQQASKAASKKTTPIPTSKPKAQKTKKPTPERIIEPLKLSDILKDSWKFFVENQILGLLTGGIMLAALITTLILDGFLPSLLTTFISSVLTAYLFYLFMIFTLQRIRGQEITSTYWKRALKLTAKPLLIASVIACGTPIGLPIILGNTLSSVFFLLTLPGLMIFTVLIFTPLIIYDRPELSYKQAFNNSTNWIRSIGYDNIAVLVGLTFINLICAVALFLPLFITIPLTAIAIADLYEAHYMA